MLPTKGEVMMENARREQLDEYRVQEISALRAEIAAIKAEAAATKAKLAACEKQRDHLIGACELVRMKRSDLEHVEEAMVGELMEHLEEAAKEVKADMARKGM